MARPSRTGGKTREAKARKASPVKGRKTKRLIAPTATRATRRSISDSSKDLKEAREQQAATAEILKVIASSPSDVQPVFDTIATSAKRLIGGFSTAVHRVIDDIDHLVAFTPTNPKSDEVLKAAFPRHRSEMPAIIGLVENGETAQIVDSETADGQIRKLAGARGWRSATYTPLMNQGTFIGFIVCTRCETGMLAENHVQLLRTFADQAVIAIENARLFTEVQERTRDLAESLQQQTATSEVLQIISSSPNDLAPVFDKMLENATRVCGAEFGSMFLLEGDALRQGALYNAPAALAAVRTNQVRPIHPQSGINAAIRGKQVVHIEDVSSTAAYLEGAPAVVELVELGGARTLVVVPMLRDEKAIGVITVYRQEVRPFSDKQIDLLTNFARQAVIAIENARLLRELRERTDDLTEALVYQTGSSNILKVIASSPTDVGPALKAIVESACEICDAPDAIVFLKDGSDLVLSAQHGPIPIRMEKWPISRAWVVGRTAVDKATQHIHDLLGPDGEDFPEGRQLVRHQGARTVLGVPLLREGEAIGVIALRRIEVSPFNDKQIDLLKSFADQAVIAIQNVRLFEEVQARTRDLAEALTYQTGSSNILNVIASSPTDVQPVLQAIVESACELCGAYDAAVVLRDGEDLRFSAHHGPIPIGLETWPINRRWTAGRAFLDRKPVHIEDLRDEKHADFSDGRELSLRMGHRSILSVPLLREGESVGAIVLRRIEVNPFTEKQIALLQTFADQAVIAIGNVRLFDEVQAKTRDLEVALQQQTATADVLKVISRSAFDLQSVLQTLVESARQLLSTDTANIYLRDGELMRVRAQTGMSDEFHKFLQERPATAERGRFIGRAFLTAEIVHLPDVLADPEYSFPTGPQVGGYRAVLGVPMVRDGRVEGVFGLSKSMPGPFTAREIEIVRTFADQALIAIENARLFGEVQDRTRELSQSLDDLRAAKDRLVQTEKLASLGQLTAGIAHEIKNPLNFVNNFSALSAELIDELNDVLKPVAMDGKVQEEVYELTGLLKDNLEKVVQHGKRADSIVKNMLLHSREGSGEHRPADINSLLDESLNLAYHGARAEKGEFNITLQRDFDADAGTIELFPQEITRAFLNLIANGVYAATNRKTDEKEPGFEPTLRATTKNLGTTVEIRIRDNGTGIPAEVQEKIFNPFFTTKPAGEGTGLGLSVTHDIIVKQHGGRIDVATEPGQFTEFTIVLPRQSNLVRRGET